MPLELLLGDGLGDERLGDERLGQVHGRATVGTLDARKHRAAGQGVPRGHVHELPLDHLELVDARLAHAAHAQQVDFHAGGLVREGRADVTAAVAVGNGDLLARPIARQRLDAVIRHAALLGRPGRRLLDAVLAAAHDIVLELVKADGVRGDVVLFVRALGQPHMGDGELQGDIGIRQDRNPLVGMNRSTIVEVRAHVDLLDADVSEPIRDEARHLTTPAPRRGLGIAAPDKDGVGVLGDILDDVVGNGLHADGIHTPDMLGTPIPALPGVWLTSLLQKAARESQQVGLATMCSMDGLGLTVTIGLRVDGERTALVLDPLDLGRDDVAGLIPGDALVLGDAAVLRIALAVGIPVDALQGVRDAIL